MSELNTPVKRGGLIGTILQNLVSGNLTPVRKSAPHPQSRQPLNFSLCKSENQSTERSDILIRAKFPDHHSKHPGVWNADPESRVKTESGGGEGAKRPARLGYWPETKKPDAWECRA
jgi:hypothetical protein